MGPRWLVTSSTDARRNLALEESIFRTQEGLTARAWKNERSVIIGSGQMAAYETDLDACRDLEVPVVRRFTGGGAVYNGPGNLNWSIFVGSAFEGRRFRFAWDALGTFAMAAGIVVESLRKVGVYAWLDRPNRILTAGGKVSGMAAYLSARGLVCHGTILLDADLSQASELTRPRDVHPDKRYVRSRNMPIANVGVGEEEFAAAFFSVLSEAEGEPAVCPCTAEESKLAERLVAWKYGTDRWNLGDPFEQWRCAN